MRTTVAIETEKGRETERAVSFDVVRESAMRCRRSCESGKTIEFSPKKQKLNHNFLFKSNSTILSKIKPL
jgi:hypothetical protein